MAMLHFLKKKKGKQELSNPICPKSTEAIVKSIMSLYHRNGEQMFFLFEDELITLKQFLLTLLPSVGEMNWPFNKDEIARVWNFLYVLHTDVTKVAAEFCMQHGMHVGKSEEIILHHSFMAEVVGKKSGRKVPKTRHYLLDGEAPLQVRPTHEIRLTSFKYIWFLTQQPFLKRLRVLRQARICTFFIAATKIAHGGERYSITCLPHSHLNAFDVHSKHTGFQGGCHTTKAKHVLKIKHSEEEVQPGLRAIVWNISGLSPSTISKTVYFLVLREQPTLIILLGGHLGVDFTSTVHELGFKAKTCWLGTEGSLNGVSILWHEELIVFQHLPAYHNTMHLRVTVLLIRDSANLIFCYVLTSIFPLQCTRSMKNKKRLENIRSCLNGASSVSTII